MTAAMVDFETPLNLPCGHVLKNRFAKSAMSEQLGDRLHNPTPLLETLYHTWAVGGSGLLMTGNVMIDRTALGEPRNVVVDDRTDRIRLQRWAFAGTRRGTRLWMQLNHPGKQIPAFLSKMPVAPSAVPLGHGLEHLFNLPRALTEAEILVIVNQFATSARIAKECGFSGVQIHGAHGYLVSQFLSPHHNRRQDRWGGSARNRRRFVVSVYRAIREAVGPAFPVGIKINSADFIKGGFSEAESAAVVAVLADEGLDVVEVSGGTYEAPAMVEGGRRESAPTREAYFLSFAETLRRTVKVPLMVTGGFRSGGAMADALRVGTMDLIGMARPLAMMPELPARLMRDRQFSLSLRRPTTGFRTIDRMTGLDIAWYERQLHRIARSRPPRPTMSPWMAVLETLATSGLSGFKRRRA